MGELQLPTDADPVTVVEGDAADAMARLPPACVDLIATDPPYFGVKADEWDNQWDTADAFLAWLGSVCDGFRRILKPNGSLYLFASPRMVWAVEGVVRQRFNVLNHIVWVKQDGHGNGMHSRQHKEDCRSWFPRTERIIFAEQFGGDDGADEAAGYTSACEATRRGVFGVYLRAEFKRAGVTNRDIAALFPSATGGLTGCVSNWLLGYNTPTATQYQTMREYLNGRGGDYLRREYEDLRREYEDLRREYEDLRREYEDLRREFSVTADVPYTDVWDYATVNAYPGKHPCEKPLRIMRGIVRASSRPGSLVLDCFAGSGTTGVACAVEGRRCVLVERDPGYAALCRKRVAQSLGKGTLFGSVA